MPKIQISQDYMYNVLGFSPSEEELKQLLVCAKAELSGVEDGALKIEFNDTNRPDLWSVMGLTRLLHVFHGDNNNNTSSFSFFDAHVSPDKQIIVDPNLKSIRPYVLGFIISGKKIDEQILLGLIQSQEKLCDNYGQHRKTVAIGMYRETALQWPIHYEAVDPAHTVFVPLGYTEELTAEEILVTHPKGIEYGHLLKDFHAYPLLRDHNGDVLSMPPIINSAHIGEVQVGDDQLFVECTGDDLAQLMLVTNILACDCHDMGFTVLRVASVFPYELENKIFMDLATVQNDTYTLTAPSKFQSPMYITMQEIETLLGEQFSVQEVQQHLKKMDIVSHVVNENTLEVEVPVYRNDFLHPVDIIEDFLIGKGLNNFSPTALQSYTVGRLTDIEIISRKVITMMVGLGFQEMIFPYLGARADFVDKMYDPSDWEEIRNTLIEIENPISENYEVVRPSILPYLLHAEHVSTNSPYPHKMCEIGKVVVQDDTENYGTRTDTVLGFLLADNAVGFTDINSIVAALLYYLNIDWHLEPIKDSRFIEGRVGSIVSNNMNYIGTFGEIHPRVLQKNNIIMPCVAGEIVLDLLL